MEQFRQIGKVLGSLKALMVFQNDIQINQRQCCFLLDSLSLAYETIAEEMRSNLRFAEKHTTWKGLEQPLKELYRVYKEGEAYIRQCFEIKDWWAKAIVLYQNRDCIEFHIHNLVCCLPIVIEAIEVAGELSNLDEDQMRKRRLFWSMKYQNEWKDPKLFQWSFGKKYLVSPEFCNRMDTVWKEDRWILLDKIHEKETSGSTKYQHRLVNLLSKNLDDSEPSNAKLLPSTILVGSKDYQVRRRLGNGGQYKEILWLGESFVLRHIKGDTEPLMHEICQLFSLAHPNILQLLCGFTDEEKKEYFLVTELMSKNIGSYMKELNSPKKRIPFSHTVAVDIMLQIARGMEYLHSKKIYHGDLNPSKILVRARINNTEGSLLAKVSGYGLSSLTHLFQKTSHSNEAPSYIWHAPEVLAVHEESGSTIGAKYAEKSDVYSFGMICFEILTGKVPFDDAHLQGDKMSRNIRAGERPLFPFHCPKYVVTLTKKCWHSDPNQRPGFSSICRILRYIKRFLVMNPDQSQADPPIPLIDYYDVETGLLNKFPSWRKDDPFLLNQEVRELQCPEMRMWPPWMIHFCLSPKGIIYFFPNLNLISRRSDKWTLQSTESCASTPLPHKLPGDPSFLLHCRALQLTWALLSFPAQLCAQLRTPQPTPVTGAPPPTVDDHRGFTPAQRRAPPHTCAHLLPCRLPQRTQAPFSPTVQFHAQPR